MQRQSANHADGRCVSTVVSESPIRWHARDRLPIVREESAGRMGIDLLEVVESDLSSPICGTRGV
jgi:hypothetical protein